MLGYFKKNLALLLIIFLATILLSYKIDKPFIGHHDWNGAFWGSVTREYLAYIRSDGFLTTLPSNLIFTHYTPFLPVLFTVSSILLGLSEYSLRLVSIIFSIIMVIFVYKIGRVLYGELQGLVASLFLVVTPMFLYFGKLPDHEPIVTSLITIAFYFYIRSEKRSGWQYYLLFLGFLTLALFESWPAYFLLVPITLVSIFVRKDGIRKILAPFAVALFVLIFHLLLILVSRGMLGIADFVLAGFGRSSTENLFFGAVQYTALNFVVTVTRYGVIHFTKILLFMSALFAIGVLLRMFGRKMNRSDVYMFVLFSYPLLFIATFRELAFIHDYKLYHFLPFVSVSSSVFFVSMIGRFKVLLIKFGLRPYAVGICAAILTFVMCTLVFFERLPYLKTLQATSFNSPGYELGNIIRQNTNAGDKVFVDSLEFNEFFGVFVNYYAQRDVGWGNLTLEQFRDDTGFFDEYKFFIVVRDKNYDSNLFEFLTGNLKSTRYGEFELFYK